MVPHENINPADYYTISASGVTRLRDNETEYTKLEHWEKEFRDYKILIKIRTFRFVLNPKLIQFVIFQI